MSDKKSEILKKRNEKYNDIREYLLSEGYKEEKAVISILKANVMAIVTAGPFIVLFVVLFFCLNPSEKTDWLDYFVFPDSFLIIAAIILSLPIHEFIHGLGWVLFCKRKWKSIEFGMMWSSLTPYCHCDEALSVKKYYVGLFLPFIILGIIPSAAAVFSGSVSLLVIGAFNILGAGGDLTIGCLIFKYLNKKSIVLDHPEECGCAVFSK
ncbi:MAG: DUF3267 domain-containing protein [Ruminococcus sp.]